MIRYTTPTITLTIKDFHFPENSNVYVTFRQSKSEITKTDLAITEDGEDTVVEVTLTQNDTQAFKAGDTVFVQVNWVTPSGSRNATSIAQISTFGNLLEEVKEYEH